MQRFLSMENEKIGTIVRYKRIVLLADSGHELPVFRTAEAEVVDMIRHVICSARYFHQRRGYALIDQELHCRPARHGHAGSQKSAFFLPTGGTPDGRGEEKSGHKAERARLSLDLEPIVL